MAPKVEDLKYLITHDVDITRREDVATLDGFVNTCITEATDALQKAPLAGFSEANRNHIANLVEGVKHSHQSIRKLLRGDRNASAVDALAIARLQLETLYNACYLLQAPQHIPTLHEVRLEKEVHPLPARQRGTQEPAPGSMTITTTSALP
jgi:hypothetical protein